MGRKNSLTTSVSMRKVGVNKAIHNCWKIYIGKIQRTYPYSEIPENSPIARVIEIYIQERIKSTDCVCYWFRTEDKNLHYTYKATFPSGLRTKEGTIVIRTGYAPMINSKTIKILKIVKKGEEDA